jgi:formamidopyrimidine-DNA glycosylase
MPELPEVETTRLGILPHIEGQEIVNCQLLQRQLRWPVTPDLTAKIYRQPLISVDRRGKYLIFRFAHGSMITHLGMSGKWYLAKPTTPIEKHTHFIAELASGQQLRFVDPRRFGALLWSDQPAESHPLLSRLGPEPLTDAFDGQYLYDRSRNRTKSIKTFIMDSNIVVGVGNIYANEALFQAGIRPNLAAGRIKLDRYQRLVDAIKTILQAAIDQGGTTLKDFYNGANQPGYFKQSLAVYGRGGMPCLECGSELKEVKLGQRQTIFCGNCQR